MHWAASTLEKKAKKQEDDKEKRIKENQPDQLQISPILSRLRRFDRRSRSESSVSAFLLRRCLSIVRVRMPGAGAVPSIVCMVCLFVPFRPA